MPPTIRVAVRRREDLRRVTGRLPVSARRRADWPPRGFAFGETTAGSCSAVQEVFA